MWYTFSVTILLDVNSLLWSAVKKLIIIIVSIMIIIIIMVQSIMWMVDFTKGAAN